MNFKHRYKITVEDEATLERRLSFKTRTVALFAGIFFLLAIGVALAIFILVVTPLKTSLPGYLKESERTATEEQHLRLDSLLNVYERNEAYLSGILNALSPKESDSLLLMKPDESLPLTPDSLLPISEIEKNFIEEIRERDKYNISLSSLGDEDNIIFGSLNSAAVISENSKDKLKAEFIFPENSTIHAVAEGKIISIGISAINPAGYEIIIQHPKGFVSKSSNIGNLMVTQGERVTNGQILGRTLSKTAKKGNIVTFELWQDGNQMLPAKFISENSSD